MKKIKRFFAALLITVMSLTTLVFASESEKIEYTDEAYATYSKTIFENAFIGITYDECKFSVENSIGYSKEAYESYLPFVQPHIQCMITTCSVHDQLREQCMISHVISAWSDT